MTPDDLGRLVRKTWVEWAHGQPAPKSSWLMPWEDLPEPDREVDRRIGVAVVVAVLRETAEAMLEEGAPAFGGQYLGNQDAQIWLRARADTIEKEK